LEGCPRDCIVAVLPWVLVQLAAALIRIGHFMNGIMAPDRQGSRVVQTLLFMLATQAIPFTPGGRQAHRTARSRKTLTPFVGVAGGVEH
jgi:hypothetical protein